MTEEQIRDELDTLQSRLFIHKMKDGYTQADMDLERSMEERVRTYERMLENMATDGKD